MIRFRLPFGGTESSDTFETGTRAAAFGGTTSIVDFAIQTRGASTIEGLDTWRAKADGNAAIDYAFHMIVTDLPDERVPELRRLADEGVTSYELFIAYPGVLLVDDATRLRRAGLRRRQVRHDAAPAGETEPGRAVAGLRGRDLDVISSDHCPFNLREQKELGRGDFSRIPNGGPGVQNRMSLIYHHGVNAGRIDVNRFVELTSTAAARISGCSRARGPSRSVRTRTSRSSTRSAR